MDEVLERIGENIHINEIFQLPSVIFEMVNVKMITPADTKCASCLEQYDSVNQDERLSVFARAADRIRIRLSTANIPVKLTCGHIFGKQCLMKYLETSQKCPICRKDMLDRYPGIRLTRIQPKYGQIGKCSFLLYLD